MKSRNNCGKELSFGIHKETVNMQVFKEKTVFVWLTTGIGRQKQEANQVVGYFRGAYRLGTSS